MSEKKYDTPLVKKLGIKPASRLLLLHEPEDFRELLIDLPADVIEVADDHEADVIVAFFTVAADVKKQVPRLKKRLASGGGLWVAWPKKTSGVATDVTFEVVQPAGLATGLVDNKVCAIDATWTGLRFVFRKK
ncbi:MAG TPA: hypothetical protein VHR66_03310 [Gemmataceae bacterium]|jgi:hypothetical protein|nr:hypothetical protein [Gemmataceae bacterium]